MCRYKAKDLDGLQGTVNKKEDQLQVTVLSETSTPDLSPTQSVCLCVLQVVEELADMIDDSLGLMDSAVQTANLEEQVPTRSMLRVHALPRHRGQNP